MVNLIFGPILSVLNSSQNPELVSPEGSTQIVLNKFSSYEELKDYIEASPQSGYWFYSEYAVERSLYIDNVLYTISL